MKTIRYVDRKTKKILIEKPPKEKLLRLIYERTLGRLTIRHITENTLVSKITGTFLKTKLSKPLINKFILEYNIKTKEFLKQNFNNFNEFFTRKLNLEKYRKINQNKNSITSPADGKILGFQKIEQAQEFTIKGEKFNIKKFLNNKKLAKEFENASLYIIRLSVPDYHRFHFPIDGITQKSKKIRGKLASVSPIATQNSFKTFWKNKRQYTIINNIDCGKVIMAEIGASNVGSIKQTFKPFSKIKKGEEKGYFNLGSTVLLLFSENSIIIDKDIIDNTKRGLETKIFIGNKIGKIIQ